MLETFQFINAAHPWFFAMVAFVLGACWGSFANVVIYRFPAGQSVISPGSHCFSCGRPLGWQDNLPIIGWLLLRGKARCCGAPFSPRYAIVEALTGGLFLACWLALPPLVALCGFLFVLILIIGTFIDWDTQELPDVTTIGGAAVGMMLAAAIPSLHGVDANLPFPLGNLQGITAAITGAVVGSGVLLWIARFAEALLRKEAMGDGDLVLMGCIGAFCGWQGAVFAIFGGSVIGGIFIALMILVNRACGWQLSPGKVELPSNGPPEAEAGTEESPPEAEQSGEASDASMTSLEMGAAIPFGPWLSAGGLVYFIWLRDPVDAYFRNAIDLLQGRF